MSRGKRDGPMPDKKKKTGATTASGGEKKKANARVFSLISKKEINTNN